MYGNRFDFGHVFQLAKISSITLRPSSIWANSRPRNITLTITLSLCSRNSRALLTFTFKIVIARLRPHADFLDLHVMAVATVLPFFLLILELAEIHDPANRGTFVWRHLHQIQIGHRACSMALSVGIIPNWLPPQLMTRTGLTRICSLIRCLTSPENFHFSIRTLLKSYVFS